MKDNILKEAITMKKILAFSLGLLLMTFIIGCSTKENKLIDLNEKLYYAPNGISFTTEKTEYSTDVKEISYTIVNTSSGEKGISGDQHFELHYKTEKGWKMVNYNRDVMFNDLARILKPNEQVSYTLELEEYYNLPLQAGEYRITDEYMVSNTFIIK